MCLLVSLFGGLGGVSRPAPGVGACAVRVERSRGCGERSRSLTRVMEFGFPTDGSRVGVVRHVADIATDMRDDPQLGRVASFPGGRRLKGNLLQVAFLREQTQNHGQYRADIFELIIKSLDATVEQVLDLKKPLLDSSNPPRCFAGGPGRAASSVIGGTRQ